jgi:hypothetical protein
VVTLETLLRSARALHGSAAPRAELPIGRDTGRTGLLTVRHVRRRLFAGGGGSQALFQLGTIALELTFQIVAVLRDAFAAGTRARIRIGAAACRDGAAFVHVRCVPSTQLSKRFCRTSHRSGLISGRRGL